MKALNKNIEKVYNNIRFFERVSLMETYNWRFSFWNSNGYIPYDLMRFK